MIVKKYRANNKQRGEEKMKQIRGDAYQQNEKKYKYSEITTNELIQLCIQKGLIEKTEYGYYFKREFFETLDLYNG